MSITDELREWAEGNTLRAGMSLRTAREQAIAIADRIDAEHEQQCAESWMRGHDAWEAIDRSDEMAEHGWVRLPKDADGEYIHFGDVLDQFGTPMTVFAMSDPDPDQGDCMLELITDGISDSTWVRARKMRHHRKPTVEDMLSEFAVKLVERSGLTNGAAQTIAEYAAKLRLAGDAE